MDGDARTASPIRVVRIVGRLNTGGVAGPILTQAIHGIHGYEQVIVAGRPESNEEEMQSLLGRLPGPVRYVDALRRSIDVRSDLVAYRRIIRVLTEVAPSVIETHTAKAGLVGRLAAARYNRVRRSRGQPTARVVHYFHGHILRGDYFGPLKTATFRWLERRLARRATDLIAVPCRQQAEELAGEFDVGSPPQYRVVPYGVEIELFERHQEDHRADFRREFGLEPDSVVVGIVGRLEPVKNHALFLDAAAGLIQRLHSLPSMPAPRVTFLVIGDGASRSQLEQRARALGIAGYVRFLGVRHDRERFYAGLDILALTSTNEGYPNVLLEAMAASRPVIATAVGGVTDLVEDGVTGLLVPAGDRDGLADGMERLVRDASLRERLARRGTAFVREHHDVRAMLSGVKVLYDELTRGAPVR